MILTDTMGNKKNELIDYKQITIQLVKKKFNNLVIGLIVFLLTAFALGRSTCNIPFPFNTTILKKAFRPSPTPTEVKKRIYKVEEGDYYWLIAEKFYQDGNLWEKVAKANNFKGLNPGDEIIIP